MGGKEKRCRRYQKAKRSFLVTSSPSVDEMHKIAQKLNTTAEDFRNSPRIFGRSQWAESGEHGSFGQISHELNPLAGLSNPIAPPVNHWIDGELAFATCQCGWAYEGPPGSVHGGIVAAIFDQFLGMAQIVGGQPGMTAYLNMSYHNRTPLNTELKLEGQTPPNRGAKNLYARGDVCRRDNDRELRGFVCAAQGRHAQC